MANNVHRLFVIAHMASIGYGHKIVGGFKQNPHQSNELLV